MPNTVPRVTLEQWCALQAVVDCGGFAQAAEELNKSQSSISYALRKLQEQLPVPVLTLNGRKAVLSKAGEVLLRRSRAVLDEALALERLAASLAQGWEPEIRIAVEVIFPPDLLLEALAVFSRGCAEAGRENRVLLIESVLSGTNEALFGGDVDLVVTGRVPPGFLGTPLMQVEFVAVAHPNHPLHSLGRPLIHRDLTQHRQLVVRDSGLRRSQDASWLGSEQRWTVSHLKTSIQALKRGLGFAWVPREHIREELANGLLKTLPLTEGASQRHELYLVFADRETAGPAARKFSEILVGMCRAAQTEPTRATESQGE